MGQPDKAKSYRTKTGYEFVEPAEDNMLHIRKRNAADDISGVYLGIPRRTTQIAAEAEIYPQQPQEAIAKGIILEVELVELPNPSTYSELRSNPGVMFRGFGEEWHCVRSKENSVIAVCGKNVEAGDLDGGVLAGLLCEDCRDTCLRTKEIIAVIEE